MLPELAQCYFGLAQLYARSGQLDKSRCCYEDARNLFQEMGMPYWEDRLRADEHLPKNTRMTK